MASELTLQSLLVDAALPHLAERLVGKGASLGDLRSRLSSNRPLFLSHLRELGVDKLGDRQRLANALAKAERTERLLPPTPMPQLRPCTYEEDDATLTVTISLPAAVTSNQLTVTIDVNSVAVELMGVPTALTGKLFAPIRPHECTWQIERTQSAEVEPGVPTSQQACAAEDALVLTIVKATPSRWTTLFVDNLARRRVPPATDPSRRQLPEVNKNVQPGLGFVPRKLDLDGVLLLPHLHL